MWMKDVHVLDITNLTTHDFGELDVGFLGKGENARVGVTHVIIGLLTRHFPNVHGNASDFWNIGYMGKMPYATLIQ